MRSTKVVLLLSLIIIKSALAIDWDSCKKFSGLNEATSSLPRNTNILSLIKKIEPGGIYTTSGVSRKILKQTSVDNFVAGNGKFTIPESMCSSATYFLFLADLKTQGVDISSLVDHGEVSGVGGFGHWNANGPGTAAFFTKTGLGKNFTDIGSAEPGDFVKILWGKGDESVNMGSQEHGHSAVFLGCKGEFFCFWSSNTKSAPRSQDSSERGGPSVRCATQESIGFLLFSRERASAKDPAVHFSAVTSPDSIGYRDTTLQGFEEKTNVRGGSAITRTLLQKGWLTQGDGRSSERKSRPDLEGHH